MNIIHAKPSAPNNNQKTHKNQPIKPITPNLFLSSPITPPIHQSNKHTRLKHKTLPLPCFGLNKPMHLLTQLQNLRQPNRSLPVVVHVRLRIRELNNVLQRHLALVLVYPVEGWLYRALPRLVRHHEELLVALTTHHGTHLGVAHAGQEGVRLVAPLLDPDLQ